MRVLSVDPSPIAEIPFLNAVSRGGVTTEFLPLLSAKVDQLPGGVQAILATGDLQGVCQVWDAGGELDLLGIELAHKFEQLFVEGKVPAPQATGVILTGDLFSAPGGDKRGATGDVLPVWEAFVELGFAWVVGVAGNHDTFSARDWKPFTRREGVFFLDGSVAALEGMRVGGVSYIIGNPDKVGRRGEVEFLESVELVLSETPDVLVLHEGPQGGPRQRGNSAIREMVQEARVPLTICGHVHWETPLAQIQPRSQVLNVDGRAVLLRS